jgi:hypothetical protein
MVAIVSPNSTSKKQNQATSRVLTFLFTNQHIWAFPVKRESGVSQKGSLLKTNWIMAIKVIAQRRDVKLGKNPGKKFVWIRGRFWSEPQSLDGLNTIAHLELSPVLYWAHSF